MTPFYICFWLGWTLIIVGGALTLACKIISLLKAILHKLEVITHEKEE